MQFVNGILIVREVDSGHPVEILGADSIDVNRQLDTLVGNLTHIGCDRTERIDIGRYGIVPNQIPGLFIIELDSTVDAVLHESEVKTDIQHACALPLQVGIGILGSCQRTPVLAIVLEEARCTVCSVCSVGAEAHGIT